MRVMVHTDGGARGNPGPAAIGYAIRVVDNDGKKSVVAQSGRTIGETTNNVAEYTAVLEALTILKTLISSYHIAAADLYSDSQLIVEQLNGRFRVKDSRMRELYLAIQMVLQELGIPVTFNLVRREANSLADSLVNNALDSIHPS